MLRHATGRHKLGVRVDEATSAWWHTTRLSIEYVDYELHCKHLASDAAFLPVVLVRMLTMLKHSLIAGLQSVERESSKFVASFGGT